MTPLELLRFLAPSLSAVPDEKAGAALAYAADFVPGCLTGKARERAQVFYAAYVLTDQERQASNAAAGSLGGVKSWKEGDVAVTFTDAAAGRTDGVYDPGGWFAKWQGLAKLCGGGSITVSPGAKGCGCG